MLSAELNSVLEKIDHALANGAEPIAAFDADGTLWDTDIGENFFKYQAEKRLVPNLPEDPWEHYEILHDQDTPKAFLWLAQINKDQPIDTVRKWAKDAYDSQKPIPFFLNTKKIIEHLVDRGVSVYIVTASVQWAVEPASVDFKIPRDNVIGVVTKVVNGIVTDISGGAISWREGKVIRLLDMTGGRRPFLSAGNTMGDLSLLESATHLPIVNCGAGPESRIYETERELIALGKSRNWHIFDYANIE